MTAHPTPQELLKRHAIALTGGIATGKSTAARALAAAGELVIDADQLAREVVAPGTPGLAAVVKEFGKDVLRPDGALDRKKLGALVFASPERRRQLEAITHPLIREALIRRLDAEGLLKAPRRFFYEAALIYERNIQADFRQVWVTFCEPATQLARLMARDGLAEPAAKSVIASQMAAQDKAARADAVIRTDGTVADVEAQVRALLAGV